MTAVGMPRARPAGQPRASILLVEERGSLRKLLRRMLELDDLVRAVNEALSEETLEAT